MAAEVEAYRNELMGLKSQVQRIQSVYKSHANVRIANQQKMARMVQTVQECSQDVALVEDVIVVSLHSETEASHSQSDIPNAPVIDQENQPSGRTNSAEEAIAIYKGQIMTLQEDLKYREALEEAETVMAGIYGQGIQNILAIMKEYCSDSALIEQIENIASS